MVQVSVNLNYNLITIIWIKKKCLTNGRRKVQVEKWQSGSEISFKLNQSCEKGEN